MNTSQITVLLYTDLVGSVDLKARLGMRGYAEFISRHDGLFRHVLAQAPGGRLLQDTGDGFYATFGTAAQAVETALRFQHALHTAHWPGERPQVRIGIHAGQLEQLSGADSGGKLVGLATDIAARVMGLAEGGQILLTRHVFDDARQYVRRHPVDDGEAVAPPLRWVAHGSYVFKGYDQALEIFEAGGEGLAPLRPPRDSDKAQAVVSLEERDLLGWRPAAGMAVPERPHWVLERKLGEGGVGEVWLGRHERLDTSQVFKFCFDADKVRSLKRELTLFRYIHTTLGERADIARLVGFQLQRPPYFLESEYVSDADLSAWADGRGGIGAIPLGERVYIVAACADALAAAHSVGVLHKDIKPANVLIAVDAGGRVTPKLADFGIGDLVDAEDLARHGITAAGFTRTAFVTATPTNYGTRIYTPPETLAGGPYTVQGDIYALGVMLYQVVAADLQRPLAPGWERDVADPLLRADIEWCVDGDPARRPAAAGELATRLRSLEARRVAQAAAESELSRNRRRQRQFRAALAGSGVLAVLMITVLFGYARERDLRREAEAAREATRVEAAKAQTISGFLQDMLGSIDPARARGRDVAVKDVLAAAATRLEEGEGLAAQPGIAAALQLTIGQTYLNLGKYAEAEPHLLRSVALRRETLGERHLETASSMQALATLYVEQGRFDEGLATVTRVLDVRREVLGEEHADTLRAMNNLAVLHFRRSRYDEAEVLWRQVAAAQERTLGPEHVETLRTMGNLGALLQTRGRYADAEQVYAPTLERQRRVLGAEHPDTMRSVANLGALYWLLGRFADAGNAFAEVLARQQEVLGPEHPETLQTSSHVAAVHWVSGRYQEARALFERVVEGRRRSQGGEHPATLQAMNYLGVVLRDMGRHDEAHAMLEKVHGVQARVLGGRHPATLETQANLAACALERGDSARAERLARSAYDGHLQALGADHPSTLDGAILVARVANAQARFAVGEQLAADALGVAEQTLGASHLTTLSAGVEVAAARLGRGDAVAAEGPARQAFEGYRDQLGAGHPRTRASMQQLAAIYDAMQRPDEAGRVRALLTGAAP